MEFIECIEYISYVRDRYRFSARPEPNIRSDLFFIEEESHLSETSLSRCLRYVEFICQKVNNDLLILSLVECLIPVGSRLSHGELRYLVDQTHLIRWYVGSIARIDHLRHGLYISVGLRLPTGYTGISRGRSLSGVLLFQSAQPFITLLFFFCV